MKNLAHRHDARESTSVRVKEAPAGAQIVRGAVLELQRTAGNAAVQSIAGVPLATDVRLAMEERLGSELGHVRVHANDDADAQAGDVGAAAFARGAEVTFSAGLYRPETEAGRVVLAHELAHVVQQTRNTGRPTFSPAELESDADTVAVGGGRPTGSAQTGVLQKIPSNEESEEARKRRASKQRPGTKMNKFLTREQKAAARSRALESLQTSGEDPTPMALRSWKEQGREDAQGALRRLAYETDPTLISPEIAADLQAQIDKFKSQMAAGTYDESKHKLRLPKGYVLGHWEGEKGTQKTPARQGFDYNNARVITEEENRQEEQSRRDRKKKARQQTKANQKAKKPVVPTPPIVRKQAALKSGGAKTGARKPVPVVPQTKHPDSLKNAGEEAPRFDPETEMKIAPAKAPESLAPSGEQPAGTKQDPAKKSLGKATEKLSEPSSEPPAETKQSPAKESPGKATEKLSEPTRINLAQRSSLLVPESVRSAAPEAAGRAQVRQNRTDNAVTVLADLQARYLERKEFTEDWNKFWHAKWEGASVRIADDGPSEALFYAAPDYAPIAGDRGGLGYPVDGLLFFNKAAARKLASGSEDERRQLATTLAQLQYQGWDTGARGSDENRFRSSLTADRRRPLSDARFVKLLAEIGLAPQSQ